MPSAGLSAGPMACSSYLRVLLEESEAEAKGPTAFIGPSGAQSWTSDPTHGRAKVTEGGEGGQLTALNKVIN